MLHSCIQNERIRDPPISAVQQGHAISLLYATFSTRCRTAQKSFDDDKDHDCGDDCKEDENSCNFMILSIIALCVRAYANLLVMYNVKRVQCRYIGGPVNATGTVRTQG